MSSAMFKLQYGHTVIEIPTLNSPAVAAAQHLSAESSEHEPRQVELKAEHAAAAPAAGSKAQGNCNHRYRTYGQYYGCFCCPERPGAAVNSQKLSWLRLHAAADFLPCWSALERSLIEHLILQLPNYPAALVSYFHSIISFLPPESLLMLQLGCRRLKEPARRDRLWSEHCQRDWALPTPLSVDRKTRLTSYAAAWLHWSREFKGYDGAIVKRVHQWWTGIELWSLENLAAIYTSLTPGVTEDDLIAADNELGFKIPQTLRAMYRFHDGQRLPWDKSYDNVLGVELFINGVTNALKAIPAGRWQGKNFGIFGGSRSVRLTQQLQTQLVPHGIETAAPQPQVVFALSFDPRHHKMIACTTATTTADTATDTATSFGGDVKVRYQH
eukprot:11988-Heterococcus_DN1.PRE.1